MNLLSFLCASALVLLWPQYVLGLKPSLEFKHGVASGDFDSNSIVLWTRVTPAYHHAHLNIHWEVSRYRDFRTIEKKGAGATGAYRDYTVKVLATGLKPRFKYYYRFSSHHKGTVYVSPVGQFRLPAPPGSHQKHLKYAIVSCTNWGYGYFNVYNAMSKIRGLDFWMHVGDYIYEYGIDEFPDPKTTVRPASSLQPQHVLVTLDDYRQRYALYHTDPDLQALHQAAPLLAAWDDHEFANNAWVNGSQEQNSTIDGPWHVRVRNAVQAYHEWLPTRYFLDDGNYLKYWRSVQFGNLATLMLLETRVTARTDPNVIPDVFSSAGAMGFSVLPPSQWSSQPAMIAKIKELKASTDAYRNLPNLTVIGQGEQLQWLNDTVIQSVKTGTRWQLLAQDTVMLESLAPDLEGAIAQEKDAAKAAFWKERYFNLTSGANATTTLNTTAGSFVPLNGVPIPVTDAMRYAVRAAQALGQYRINYDFDSWAGYQYNKRQILQAMASSRNAIIYGGDSHNAWGGIESLDGKPFAAEFDGPAVTSIGFEGYFPFVPTDLVAAGMLVSNGEFGMKYAETNHKGYMLVTLNHSNHHTEYVMVDNIISRNYQAYCDYAVDSIDGQVGTWVQSSTCLGA